MSIKNLTIIARTWYDSRAGNTYHSVKLIADGEEVATVPMTYGYGEQWKRTAVAALKDAGLVERLGGLKPTEPLWKLVKREGINLTTDVVEVAKESQLHQDNSQ